MNRKLLLEESMEMGRVRLRLDRFYDLAKERLANRPDDLAALSRDLNTNPMEWSDRLYELEMQSSTESTNVDEYERYEACMLQVIDQWSAAAPYICPLPEKNQAIPHKSPSFASVVDIGALAGAEPDMKSPEPLTTVKIAYSFAGLHWGTAEAWKKPLGNKPKWLQRCIVRPGTQGSVQTRWNPVLIGAALVQKGYAKPNTVRARFQKMDPLSPWLEAWKTYEADFLADD